MADTAGNTPSEDTPPVVGSVDEGGEFDIDELISPEMKAAYNDNNKDEPEDTPSASEEGTNTEDNKDDNASKSSSLSEEDLDLSGDSIDKLLDGDPTAIVKKTEDKDGEEKSDIHFWHEDEDYKTFVENHYQFDAGNFDEVIKKAVDTKACREHSICN